MKQKFFLGIDVTPRKEYRKEIARLREELFKKKEKCELEENERKLLAEERTHWKQKYHDLLTATPARGKDGKFVKRNKSHNDRALDMEQKA